MHFLVYLKMKRRLSNLILLVIVLFVILIAAEIITRSIVDAPPISDNGWYTKSNNEILGYVLTPDKGGIFQGHEAYVNEGGRRDYHDVDYLADKELVAFVGDSFIFGQGVDQNDTLPKQFEDKYNGVTTLNFGIGGYNLEQEVELIEKVVLEQNVSKIFLVYYINDIEPKITFDSEEEIDIPTSLIVYNNILKYSRFANYLKFKLSTVFYNIGLSNQGYIDYFNELYSNNSSSWISFESNITKLASVKRDNDVDIYFVVYPAMSSLNNKHPYTPIYEKVINTAKKNGLKTINLLDAFKDKDATKLRANMYDNHPNKEAHTIAADYLISQIYDDI